MNYLARIFLGTSLVLGTVLVASTEVQSINLYNDYDEEALTQLTDGEALAKAKEFSHETYKPVRITPRRQVTSAKMKDFVSPGQYAVFIGCDEECSNVKIKVTDSSGKELASAKGTQSAYIVLKEDAFGGQPYKIETEVKCNTSGKSSGVDANERKVEACYAYSSIWRKTS
ncbi:hypothetical protein PCC8801_0941 [Rippkaea orientalis PCC 8801]|uniref:Uncharacterized protein n=1 Tax=Rippkaea orientalis (strain PCC 8801 / RF-1) TaxID=41431 RepID=B7JZS5_RIPO1|nr:hypothetical protein [Rippkaea orientalis]ACK65018.1 hypothetical protein PCC8801_0941 [Rippkaea orientalis PCC 8801]